MKKGLLLWLLLPVAVFADRKWREKLNCQLIPNEANDGDSFHVKWNTRTYIFRLLYVDTCESDDSVPERLTEQAAHFGISEDDVVKMGKAAKKFTADWLKEPFTAWTQFDDALGRSVKDRDYAMITRGDENLSVELVRHGLARIFGKQETPEEFVSEQQMRFRLKSAEDEARKEKRGAWAFSGTLKPTRFAPPPSLPGPAAPPATSTPPVKVIYEQQLTIARATQVYSLLEPGKVLGFLTVGKEVTVLKEESPNMVRVRFRTSAGQVYEAQCRRSDLGL